MSYAFAYRRYRLPFRAPLRTAHGPWSEREGVLVRLTEASGRECFGEAAPIPWFGTETCDEIVAACRELGPEVDDARLDRVPARLGCLRYALHAARSPENWTPRQPHLAVAALLPAGRAALKEIAPKADVGFRIFKWKVGVGDVADELAWLDELCGALPSGGKLRLDANGAWDRRQAERWLERCAERPVEMVEQPCAAAHASDHPERADDLLLGLAGDFPTPIGLDESLVGADDVDRWITRGWQGVYVVKPSLIADIAGVLARLERAKASVVFSSALETGVGAQAALRAAFSWGGETRAVGFGVWPLFADATFDGPYLTPFLRPDDLARLSSPAVWSALVAPEAVP